MARPDQRSAEADAWRPWYKTARWQRLRAAQLARQPLCQRCLRFGLVIPATVAHHVVRHRGDPQLFWHGQLESVCAPCHDGAIAAEEARGFAIGNDASGRPVDPTHPWNRGL